jgi:hypothetical protein
VRPRAQGIPAPRPPVRCRPWRDYSIARAKPHRAALLRRESEPRNDLSWFPGEPAMEAQTMRPTIRNGSKIMVPTRWNVAPNTLSGSLLPVVVVVVAADGAGA